MWQTDVRGQMDDYGESRVFNISESWNLSEMNSSGCSCAVVILIMKWILIIILLPVAKL